LNLAIDLGNTSSRLYLYDGTRRMGKEVLPEMSAGLLEKFIEEHSVRHSILSSVVENDFGIVELLHAKTHFVMLNSNTALPIDNQYKTPETLGADRLANVVGASVLHPDKNVLVIDAGTCIKYDFINRNKQYSGGSISPGFKMRLDAMHHFTGKLPQLEPTHATGIGGTTKDAMMTGAFRGIIHEMNGFIQEYSQRNPVEIVMTGGDARYFVEELNFPIFAEPDLTGIGLNEILQFNIPH
jgi:type III pantothenate kinase